MESRAIRGYISGLYKRLIDKVGALEKSVKLKRMEPYADIIGDVLASYNTDDSQRTMMYRLIRQPEEGTTNRRKHTNNVRDIAGEIADNFDWLNSDITRIMGKEHDTGHTFLGHSGEWWISSINETYGLPNYVHNALGARKLVYKDNVYDEIAEKIRESHPDISTRKLNKIKNDLWMIMDGINCHNGEKSEYSYSPDFSKNEKRFEEELMGCYAQKGFDRNLVPATAEGSLMRLCDKISYIPFDLVDIFRNGCNIETGIVNGEEYHFYDEYRKRLTEIGMPKGSLERLLDCKTEEEYDGFAIEMQKHLIQDVVKNTRRNNIRMSPEMSEAMHAIRTINNQHMVNYTVMKEDHETYVPAIEMLMQKYADVIIDNHIIDEDDVEGISIQVFTLSKYDQEQFIKKYENNPAVKGFAEFMSHINRKDYQFTVESVKKALERNIDTEIKVAEDVAMGRVDEHSIQVKNNKAIRLNRYIDAFKESIKKAGMPDVFDERNTDFRQEFRRNFWLKKTRERIKKEALSLDSQKYENAVGTLPLQQMVAMELSAQYLASLNDNQFFELLQNSRLIDKEQVKSLQRPYKTFDFRGETQKHATWDNLEKLQKQEIEENKEKERKKANKKRPFERFLSR